MGGDLDQTGFEVEGNAKFRFLRQQDTGDAVELAVMGSASPQHERCLPLRGRSGRGRVPPLPHHGRSGAVPVGLPGAGGHVHRHGGTDTAFGFLGSFAAGVDIIPKVQFALEAKLRDDLKRFGVAVTYLF
ncbi:MAG: hypothetical protein R3F43_14305 [bacterium]